jgi:hypothetical protein
MCYFCLFVKFELGAIAIRYVSFSLCGRGSHVLLLLWFNYSGRGSTRSPLAMFCLVGARSCHFVAQEK